MLSILKRRFGLWIPHVSARESVKRAVLAGERLPPGRILNLGRALGADRLTLIEEAARNGPIFKAFWGRRLWIFVTGLARCRRFLREHGDSISLPTIRLESLIPEGYMRAMEGDTHRKYREALVRATDRSVVDRHREDLERVVEAGLASYAKKVTSAIASAESSGSDSGSLPHTMAVELSAIARSMLIQIFLGARPGSAPFNRLESCYDQMGEEELVWHVGEPQKRAFAKILQIVREEVSEDDCILSRLREQQALLDDTMLGNLIYMVEVGRFDLYSLFRWILKFAVDNPDAVARAATDAVYADAFVSETLRHEQSEGLVRKVHRDIEFDGYFIPSGARVRLCTWEAHKSPEVFPDPFAFRPERFVGKTYPTDQYAPFGLGIHHCPMWEITLVTSRIFLQTLARSYVLEGYGDGPAQKNTFHWQPSRSFWVRLDAKNPAPEKSGAGISRS